MADKNLPFKEEVKKTITRSSPYPSASLPDSIQRARKIWLEERKGTVPVAVAVSHFGYAETSSGGRQSIATLLQFGLLQSEGASENRVVRLTERALTILLAEDDSEERLHALQEAVRMPKLYSEILAKWPEGIPSSDNSINYFLLKEKNFNPNNLKSFIADMRASFAYAKVDHPREFDGLEQSIPGDGLNAEAESSIDLEERTQAQAQLPSNQTTPLVLGDVQTLAGEVEWLRGALSKETTFRLLVRGALGGREIGRLIKLLEAQKLILEEDDS